MYLDAPGLTSISGAPVLLVLFKVMDVYVNNPFKRHIRNDYLKFRAKKIVDGNPSGKPSRQDRITWVLNAWADIPGTLRKAM